jgi:hypothetical protein
MSGEVMPFQRCDHALGRRFVGGHVGSQSNLSQGADWLGPACDLACGAERGNKGGFQIKASSKTEEPLGNSSWGGRGGIWISSYEAKSAFRSSLT